MSVRSQPTSDAPRRADDGPLRVIVLTCTSDGFETADVLAELTGIDVAAVVLSPHRRLPFRRRLKKVLRSQGALRALYLAALKPFRLAHERFGREGRTAERTASGARIVHCRDFNEPESLRTLRSLEADIAVVDGTYILPESVFAMPRLGSINLHCGRVPEYRGSPPAFWELYDGVPEVGVTIHRVSADLDAGTVLAEESFAMPIAPPGDPVRFTQHFWRTVLRPNGLRMIGDVLQGLRAGTIVERKQPVHERVPNRTPSRAQVRELRRRVKERRRTEAGAGGEIRGANMQRRTNGHV